MVLLSVSINQNLIVIIEKTSHDCPLIVVRTQNVIKIIIVAVLTIMMYVRRVIVKLLQSCGFRLFILNNPLN